MSKLVWNFSNMFEIGEFDYLKDIKSLWHAQILLSQIQTDLFWFSTSRKIVQTCLNLSKTVQTTARPWDTLFWVPEKNRAMQNRASWGLYLCTKWIFFPKNSVSARLLAKIRVSQGYCYVVQCTLHLLRS